MRRHDPLFISFIMLLLTAGCAGENPPDSPPAEKSATPTDNTEASTTASPDKNQKTVAVPEKDEKKKKPLNGSVTLPLRPTQAVEADFGGPCEKPETVYSEPLSSMSFIDGRAMSEKSDTLFKPPWEVEFGRTYVGPQGMLAPGDGKLYVCSGVDEMVILDVSNPRDLKPFAQLRPSTELEVLEPREGMAVLHHLAIEDMPNVWGRCEHIQKREDTVYFSHRGDYFRPNGYVIAYTMGGEKPVQQGIYVNKERSFEGFAVVDQHLFIAQHQHGLAIVKHKGKTFSLVSELAEMSNAWDVAVHKSHAFVADGSNGLVVAHIGNLRKPSKVAHLPLNGVSKSIKLTGDGTIAYIATGAHGLAVVDISKPSKPLLIAQLETPGTASRLSMAGNLLSLADWNEARVYSISDPRKPALISSKKIENEHPVSRTVSVAMHNDTLFVGEWFGVYSFQVQPDKKAPDVDLHEQWFDLGVAASGSTAKSSLLLRNAGNAPLAVSSISSSLESTSISPTSFQIEPGGEQAIQIGFSPTANTLQTGLLRICSNDPDESGTTIRIRGNAGGRAIGQSPPDVQLSLLDGSSWSLREKKGHPVLLAYFATF